MSTFCKATKGVYYGKNIFRENSIAPTPIYIFIEKFVILNIMKNILVLCTGNICRSPTAHYLLQEKLSMVTK